MIMIFRYKGFTNFVPSIDLNVSEILQMAEIYSIDFNSISSNT